MKKILILIIRLPLLMVIFSITGWFLATPEFRARYMPWAPQLIAHVWPGRLPAQLQMHANQHHNNSTEPTLARTIVQNSPHMIAQEECKPKTKPVEIVSTKVYQWIDETGKVRFSDTPPEEKNIETKTTDFSKPTLFSINLDTQEATLPPFIRNRLEAQLNQIYRYLSDELELSNLQQTELNLKLFDDKDRYDQFQMQYAPNLGNTSGFYNPRENLAAIHTAGYSEQAFAVTRHESTHAILSSLFGYVPIWLNEGLAETFEVLHVQGQSRTLSVKERHIKLLIKAAQNNALPSLSTFWDTPHQQWYDKDKLDRYAMSWALSFFLLSEDQGRLLLAKMMNKWLDQPCRPFSSVDFFQANWSGGVSAFEDQWLTWLKNLNMQPIHF